MYLCVTLGDTISNKDLKLHFFDLKGTKASKLTNRSKIIVNLKEVQVYDIEKQTLNFLRKKG